MKTSACVLGLLATLVLPSALAVNQEIRALFQPDPNQPNKNVFVNKTPNSGYCATYPTECTDNKMFSIQVPLRFNSNRALRPGDDLPLKVPANWRQLTVTHAGTQESETVEVRIIGIGSQFTLSDSAANLVGVTDILEGHQKLWTTNSWVYAPAPCRYSGVGSFGPRTYRFFWKAPEEAACIKTAAFAIPSMSFNTVDIAYELRTPNPLGMSTGHYTGSLAYTIGPGGDFDFGPSMTPDDNNLTLDFVLDVQHVLKVDLPPGGNKVILEPQGGWQSFLEQGRKPVRLFRDQMFHIWASSRFRMSLECEYRMNSGCGIINRAMATHFLTEVTVSVSLPPGLVDSNGQPVRNMPVSHSPSDQIQIGNYVDRKPGTMHFNMDETNTKVATGEHFRGHPWQGRITVIFDSEV